MNNRLNKYKLYLENKALLKTVLIETIPENIRNSHFDDFISEGKLKIIINLDKFDPEVAKFSTWAWPLLKNCYLRFWNSLSERRISKGLWSAMPYTDMDEESFISLPCTTNLEKWLDYRIMLFRFVMILMTFEPKIALQLFQLLYEGRKFHELTVPISKQLANQRKNKFYNIWNSRRLFRNFQDNARYIEDRMYDIG